MRNYLLRNILSCDSAQQLQVLQMRNTDRIRMNMLTEHIISVPEHSHFIAGLRSSKDRKAYVVLNSVQAAVGLVAFSAIDLLHRTCNWAFYVSDGEGKGLGSAIEYCVLNHVFETLGMTKLNCVVLESNAKVVAMHEKFGFKREGLQRSQVIKDGQRIGLYLLGLTVDEWLGARHDVVKGLTRHSDAVSVSFDRLEQA